MCDPAPKTAPRNTKGRAHKPWLGRGSEGLLAPPQARLASTSDGRLEGLFYIQIGGVEQARVARRPGARRRGPNRARRGGGCRRARPQRSPLAAPGELPVAAPGAHLGRRGDKDLHAGVGADHRADVAPVEDRAAGPAREARAGSRRGPRGPPGWRRQRRPPRPSRGRAAGVVETGERRAPAAAAAAASSSSSGAAVVDQGPRRRPGRAGRCRDAAGRNARRAACAQRALAGGGRSVDGDDHANSRRLSASIATRPSLHQRHELGKLVAIMPASSIVTGCSRGEAHDQESSSRCDDRDGSRPCRRPRRRRAALDDQVVALDRMVDAVARASPAATAREPVAFLDPQLGKAAHPRLARRQRRRRSPESDIRRSSRARARPARRRP